MIHNVRGETSRARHVTILAALHIAFGGIRLVGALNTLITIGFGGGPDPDVWNTQRLQFVGIVLTLFAQILSLPGIVVGVGLLKRKPWAWILAIVLSILYLINFPLGTALAVYGLWVLLSQDTRGLFAPH